MAKMKYTVSTPIGEVTRTTERSYTHVVVCQGFTEAELRRRHAADVKFTKERLAKLLADRDSDFMNSYNEEARRVRMFLSDPARVQELAERSRTLARQYSAESIKSCEEGLAKWANDAYLEERIKNRLNWGQHTFCGRRDLAEKAAAKYRADGCDNVAIVETDVMEDP